jgi:restriction endonuclease
MKLQFDSNQAYQQDATRSIVDIFKGQPLQTKDFEIQMKASEDQLQMGQNFVIGNKLLLAEETLLKNLQDIQKKYKNDNPNTEFEILQKLDGLNFSVEMETGTGKTYVYLRTVHELHKNYGFKKFVIVVPSIAIKEGVLKNLQITADHFSQLYESPQMDFSVYDSKQSNGRKRSIVRNFARNNSLQILVINIDSFAKDSNIINQISEDGIKPIELLQATNPVVIVDEPQNMETEIRKTAIGNLNPLCTLRYSATHKYHYNLCYKLDPVQAYDLGLVKKIEVDSVLAESGQNEAFIELVSLKPTSKTITIQLKIHVNDPKKGVVEKVVSELKNLSVPKPKIRNIKGGLDITREGIEAQFLGGREVEIQRAVHQMPDILGYIQSRTHLTKDTILKILIKAGKSGEIFQNPQGMMDLAAQTINRTLNEMMVDGIKYERIAGRNYQMELFENEELEGYLENMVKVQSENKTLYDYTLVDSDIESQFAKDLETDERVQFYLKLPAWFKIKTPIGSYNPDWAIVFEQDKRVYFVAETKGSLDTHDLRTPEKMKIRCGTKHFEQMDEVRFKQVTKVADIMV